MRQPWHCPIGSVVILAAVFMSGSCAWKADPSPAALYSMDVKGNHLKVILSHSVLSYWGPALSPDGTKLVFTRFIEGSHTGELYLADVDGSNLAQLTDNGRSNYLPSWSPDGRIIPFISQGRCTDTAEIYTIHVNGTGEMRLTDNNAYEYGTSWSRDGRLIVFGTERDGEWQIYTMDPDGSNQRPLPTPSHGNAPDLSPDGMKIVFTSDRDGDDDIWVMNLDGSDQQNLTQNDAWDDQPRWSRDGSKIAFSSDRNGVASVFVMDANGGNPRALNQDGILEMMVPVWAPDSRTLIFHAVRIDN